MCHPKYSSAEISGKEEETGETGKSLTSTHLHPFSEMESTASGHSLSRQVLACLFQLSSRDLSLAAQETELCFNRKDLNSTAPAPFIQIYVHARSKSSDALNAIICIHNSVARSKMACFYFKVE